MADNQNKKKRILGVESNIFFVGLTSFLTDTTTKMVYSILPLFLTTLGASKTEISLIEGIAESTASVLKSLSGWWSDKIGRNKPFMIIGYGITALLSPLFAFRDDAVAGPVDPLCRTRRKRHPHRSPGQSSGRFFRGKQQCRPEFRLP